MKLRSSFKNTVLMPLIQKVIVYLQTAAFLSIQFSGSGFNLHCICICICVYNINQYNAGISHEGNLSSHKHSDVVTVKQWHSIYAHSRHCAQCMQHPSLYEGWIRTKIHVWEINRFLFFSFCLHHCTLSCLYRLLVLLVTGYCWRGMLWSLADVTN